MKRNYLFIFECIVVWILCYGVHLDITFMLQNAGMNYSNAGLISYLMCFFRNTDYPYEFLKIDFLKITFTYFLYILGVFYTGYSIIRYTNRMGYMLLSRYTYLSKWYIRQMRDSAFSSAMFIFIMNIFLIISILTLKPAIFWQHDYFFKQGNDIIIIQYLAFILTVFLCFLFVNQMLIIFNFYLGEVSAIVIGILLVLLLLIIDVLIKGINILTFSITYNYLKSIVGLVGVNILSYFVFHAISKRKDIT